MSTPAKTTSSVSRSSSSKRKAVKEPGACSKCWTAYTRAYNKWANTTVSGRAISAEWGALFNFVTANALFWAIGFPLFLDHRYDNDDLGDDGEIASGSKGSGAFIVTIVMVIIATLIYVYKLVRNVRQILADDAAKAADAAAAAEAEKAEAEQRSERKRAQSAGGGVEETKAAEETKTAAI